MIRPQVNNQKKHSSLIDNLKKNDKVVMRDGICGKIIDFKGENKILLETANETKIIILKSYVASIDK